METWENFIFVHFDMTFLTTLTQRNRFLYWDFGTYWEKNPLHQTQYFKLENWKNPVQIDRGSVTLLLKPKKIGQKDHV